MCLATGTVTAGPQHRCSPPVSVSSDFHDSHNFIMFRLHVLFSWRLSCFRSVQHLLLGGHTSVIIIGGSISWLDSRNGLIFSFLARFELVLCISIIIFLCTANVSHQKNWLLGNK